MVMHKAILDDQRVNQPHIIQCYSSKLAISSAILLRNIPDNVCWSLDKNFVFLL